MPPLPEINIPLNDFNRLSSLLNHTNPTDLVSEGLFDELDRANIVPREQLPENVVCMNSKIRFRNELTGKVYEKALVYPNEVMESPDNISILTPAGTALLGLGAGDSIEWPLADKRTIKIVLLEVIQPANSATCRIIGDGDEVES
jgi:regulator of nucleoside diphosphate kinase